MIKTLSLAFAAALLPALASAQAPAAPQQPAQQTLTPQQQALIQGQNQQMAQAAEAVAQMIDKDQAGNAWDGASTVAKSTINRATFVSEIAKDRKELGALRTRTARSVTRSRSDGGKVPAGNYINVAFASQFANQKDLVRELVSFHLDADSKWRLAGYTVR